MNRLLPAVVLVMLFAGACQQNEQVSTPSISQAATAVVAEQQLSEPLFALLSPTETGVTFNNDLGEDVRINPYRYINAFNGGGVGVGDFNNDGLPDLYFTANLQPNQLYIADGGLKFRDVTATAGVDGGRGWSSGVALADVNGDGWLDIYLCKQYLSDSDEERKNYLYINNGDLTFSEKAKEYGLDNDGLSVQATFFDYDLDGDLDLYLGNHPWNYTIDYTYNYKQQQNPQLKDSDRLYRNNGDETFTDVTAEAGILNFGFTLGVVASDFNKDGYPDIYIANDHAGPDRFWQNNGDGTFTNVLDQAMGHTANFAMGIDAADINNDGWVDICNVDMLAEDNYRQKKMMSGMDRQAFWRSVDAGYHYQYMRNMLQLNNGNGTFSEIGQLAGITQTDWSWTALFADFSNNGRKDLYITNGYRINSRDNDFLLARKAEIERRKKAGLPPMKQSEWGDQMYEKLTATKLPNYYFENNGDFTFSKKTGEYGLGQPGFSHGACYADLDLDGDLDLVVNNMDAVAHVYRNNAADAGRNWLRVKLEGTNANTHGIGAKVTIEHGSTMQYVEVTHTRGFQSSVEPVAHFGTGGIETVDKVLVEWPDGSTSMLANVPTGQLLTIKQAEANPGQPAVYRLPEGLFAEVGEELGVDYRHRENPYDDYEEEVLLPHKMSQFGPSLAAADVNGDGNEDFFVGGAAKSAGALYLANGNAYEMAAGGPWQADAASEDVGAAFLDVDGDGDQDLYVSSGGNEFPIGSPLLQDRLYLNDGTGTFTKASGQLPDVLASTGCVVPGDYDADGDMDLFVGGRVVPGRYPMPARSYILQNDGSGTFDDVTKQIAPDLVEPGLVTTALWMDFDGSGTTDLVVAGEWMPIGFYAQQSGSFENRTESMGFAEETGWWNRLHAADFDNDGDLDIVAGNLGLNYKYKAQPGEPFQVWCHDFDQNDHLDIVLGYYNEGTCFPVRGRQCSSEQIPDIKKKFPSYQAFATANLEQIYGNELEEALHYKANNFASCYLENTGDGNFRVSKLPNMAQFSLITGIVSLDYNNDGNLDMLLAGNLYVSEVETGRADAGTGVVLLGDGKGGFEALPSMQSGFFANRDVKDLVPIQGANGRLRVLVANNDSKLQLFEFRGGKGNIQLAQR